MANAPETSNASLLDDRSFFGHPRGLSTLFLTEMWERFSYYGIRPLLVLFMSAALAEGGFGFPRAQASAIVGIYAASVYLASLPGGWVADRILGLRRAVLWGAVLITAGHLSIGLSSFAHSKVPFFLGLILIVMGTGLLKPNISATVGELYPEGGARRDAGFSVFYMGINTGAFLGQIITGILGERVGWGLGFGVAGVGMFLGLVTFWLRAPKTLGSIGTVVNVKDEGERSRAKLYLAIGLGLFALVVIAGAMGMIALDAQAIAKKMTVVLVSIAVLYFGYLFFAGGLTGNEKKRVAVIMALFVFAAIFWAAFEQAPTSLNLFARDFTNRDIGGWQMPATWFQSINSLFIIIMAPVFAAIWLRMGRTGRQLSSPSKFALGLLLAAVGFGLMLPAANAVVASNGVLKVAPWWLVASYFFQTCGELCLSPVGLSSMTKLSPKKYVGQMMGIWFLASSVGNVIAGLVGGNVDPNKLEQMPKVFSYTSIALVVSAVILGLLAIPIKRMMAEVPANEQ
ncbi:MAG: amino acid/peptide transporter [Gemmatimonadetes bacterium]|nr:amino acid/peptide transporter [Gemmatimonadota bacterium]